jgi:hypothetical protein
MSGYVNAQYRFLVKPTGDYTAYFADPDIYLLWADILSVLIPTSSALSSASLSGSNTGSSSTAPHLETHEGAACPICLSPPTAPRMTKCGHVFCFPCILHYLSSHDQPASGSSSGISTPSSRPGAAPGTHGSALVRHAPPPTHTPAPPKWKRCPICWDAIYARDVKAVTFHDARAIAQEHEAAVELPRAAPPDGGERLTMRLIERPHLTTMALPQSSTWPAASFSGSNEPPLIPHHSAPWHFQPDVLGFAKLMLATPALLLQNLARDAAELGAERQLLLDLSGPDEPSLVFVALALEKVKEQMQMVERDLDTQAVREAEAQAHAELREHQLHEQTRREQEEERRRARKAALPNGRDQNSEEAPAPQPGEQDAAAPEATEGTEEFLALRFAAGGAVAPAQEETPSGRLASRPRPARRNLNPPSPSSSSYFFYQAASGQHIYLHPLDIKILLSEFGSYARFPRTLRLKIQGADEGSMNEELRRRCKYLTHLPTGTDVVFVEVDWEAMSTPAAAAGEQDIVEAPLVRKTTLQPYEQGLRQRRHKRRDRERRDDRAKLRFEEREAAARPGGAMAAARREAAVASLAEDPELGFGSSVGSSVGGGGLAAMSSSSAASNGASPSFREAALWGAERDFPIHPGVTEDFPPPAVARISPSRLDEPALPQTVWGTAAARPSFAATLHSSSRRAVEEEQEGPDWGFLEWEDDVISGGRSGAMRESRGLNRQTPRSGTNTPKYSRNPSATSLASSTRRAPSTTTSAAGAATDDATSTTSGAEGQRSDAEPATPTPAQSKKAKPKKKKLVLTAGGRGMA